MFVGVLCARVREFCAWVCSGVLGSGYKKMKMFFVRKLGFALI